MADGPTEVRRAVRQQIAAGPIGSRSTPTVVDGPATVSPPLSPSRSSPPSCTRPAGLPVAAHASTDEAIRRAVEAGVQTIEHGYEASDIDVLRNPVVVIQAGRVVVDRRRVSF